MRINTIIGIASTRQVFIEEDEILPDESRRVVNHSPDGFSWGYGGSGPSQLALALCLHFTDRRTALRKYQIVKHEVISKLPMNRDFILNVSEITKYLE